MLYKESSYNTCKDFKTPGLSYHGRIWLILEIQSIINLTLYLLNGYSEGPTCLYAALTTTLRGS